MSDAEFIPKLVDIAGSTPMLDEAERQAATAIHAFDGENYPSNSCSITQSKLFQAAGIDVPDTYLALAFVSLLEKRGWSQIEPSDVRSGKVRLQPGDVGTTCFGGIRHPGTDHVYLVVRPMSEDENLVADNQATAPHFRFIDGTGGKSPTRLFLRAR